MFVYIKVFSGMHVFKHLDKCNIMWRVVILAVTPVAPPRRKRMQSLDKQKTANDEDSSEEG